MADFKRRTLILCTGKQIKLYGNSIAIGPSGEIGEGTAPNIFSELISLSTTKNSKETDEQNEAGSEQKEDLLDGLTDSDGRSKKKKQL